MALNQLRLWLQHNSGEMRARKSHNDRSADVPGLIVDALRGTSLYSFLGWQHAEDTAGKWFLEIECLSFPKRRNLLKSESYLS